MAGNTSAPGTTVTSRALSLLGAFDQRHRILSLTELAGRAGLPMPTAHRLVGELVEWGALIRLGRRSLRHREATVGRRAAGTGPDRAAAGGVPVPPRRVRGDARHRAPGGPRPAPGPLPRTALRTGVGAHRQHGRFPTSVALHGSRQGTARLRAGVGAARGPAVEAAAGDPAYRHRARTPRRPAAPSAGRGVCDDGRGDEPRRLLGGRPDPAGHRRRRLRGHRRPQPATRPPAARARLCRSPPAASSGASGRPA